VFIIPDAVLPVHVPFLRPMFDTLHACLSKLHNKKVFWYTITGGIPFLGLLHVLFPYFIHFQMASSG